jgi:pimeloyl-ACP methyl ester carboxylesterase
MEALGDFPFTKDDTVQFDSPTLVIRGMKSNFVKDSTLPLFKLLFPKFEVVSLNTGHWVHSEDPAGFMEAIIGFIEREK